MDSLQGILVEYKLDTFNIPRTGTTSCPPKIGYVDLTRNPALDTLALNSPLGHLNGDNAYSPQIPEMKPTVTSKVQFLQLQHVFRQKCNEHNPSHVQRHTLPSQPSHNSISSQYSQPFTSLAAPKANPIFHAANKNLILKHISTIAILLLHSTFISHNLARGLTTLSEETTQRKHTYVTPIFLANNKLSLATNKPNSPAKIILQPKLRLKNYNL